MKKASQKSDIPNKIVKSNAGFFGNFICENFSYCLKKGEFPCVLKHADVIPVHEKDGSFSILHRNIETLGIEIFKFLNGLFPQIMNEIFQVKLLAPYYLRDENELYSRNPVTLGLNQSRLWHLKSGQ